MLLDESIGYVIYYRPMKTCRMEASMATTSLIKYNVQHCRLDVAPAMLTSWSLDLPGVEVIRCIKHLGVIDIL